MATQLAVAINSRLLAGVHGAGNTIGLFLPPDSILMELKPFKMPSMTGYENMARSYCAFEDPLELWQGPSFPAPP